MMLRRFFIILITLVSVQGFAQDVTTSPSPSAVAAPKKQSSAGGDKKTTSINFEDELIEGEVKKPELLYLLQKKQFNFKRLIKLRENFLPEMGRTAEDVGRGKSGN